MNPALGFCAHCVRDVPTTELVERPATDFGSQRAGTAKVCTQCDSKTPRAATPVYRGYEPTGGLPSAKLDRDKIRAAERRMGIPLNRVSHRKGPMKTRTQGWILERVAMRDLRNKPRDQVAALETLRDKPWFASVRYLGAKAMRGEPTGGWHIFERPPVVTLEHEFCPPRPGRG